MSELRVDKLTPQSGTALQIGDSSDVITIPAGATITNSGTATGFGGGKLKQIIQSELTGVVTTTSSTYVALTGVTASITPTATSSKILIMLTGSMSTTASNQGHLQLFRDSTQIHMGDAAGSRDRDSYAYRDFVGSSNGTISVSIMYLDPNTPADTTTAIVYSVKWKTADSSTLAWNSTSNDADSAGFPRNASSLILQEIGV